MATNTLDNVAIRRRFLLLFLSTQTIKIAQFCDAFIKASSGSTGSDEIVGFSTILFWCLVDGGFFVLLRRYIRPRLNLLGIILLSLAMFGLNTGFIAALSASSQSLINQSAKGVEYTVEQDESSNIPAGFASVQEIGRSCKITNIPQLDTILNTSFIVGSHTVKVRPPIRTKLNPNATNFCFTDKESDLNDILIPIMVKGVPPFYVDFILSSSSSDSVKISNQSLSWEDTVKFIDSPQQGESSYLLTHDKSDVQASQGKKVFLYGISPAYDKLALVGPSITFELLSLKDKRGDSAFISGEKSIKIHKCPTIQWINANDGVDFCLEDKFSATIEAEGVLPLSVLYIVQAGRNERIENLDFKENANLDELKYAKVQQTIEGVVVSDDKISYKLLRVTDGLNNSVQFSSHELSNTILPPVHVKSTNKLIQDHQSTFSIVGHSPPQASFLSCSSKIRTVYDAQFQRAPQVSVSVQLQGTPPFSLLFEFIPDSDAPAQPFSMDGIESDRADLTAYEPGTFVLLKIEDKFCSSKIPSTEKCIIQPVLPPSFAFSTSPIEESCFGAVGANVDLSFTGEGPFWLEYSLEKKSLYDDRVERIPHDREIFRKNRASLVLKPKEPGVYRYIFDRVGDKNYNEGIPILESSVTQIVHPHSTAAFVIPNQRAPYHFIRCKGQAVDLQVAVQGSGPWTVAYEITHTKRHRISVDVPEKDRSFHILVDQLTDAGVYSVDLIEIKDGNGCNVKLQTDSVMIEVLPTRPSISFSSDKPVYILDNGVASLPISLSGRGPFDIGVVYADGKERKLRLPGSARFIDFPGVGIHKLVSISDSICEGQVEGVSQVQVFSIDRPTMDVPRQANTVLPDACVGTESSFQVKVHGKAPFIIGFSQTLIPILLDGDSLPKESAKFTETVDTSFLQLAVNTSKAGLHTYSFNSLADDNYKTPVTLPKPIVFSQKIHPIPKAYFIEPEHRVFHCASAAKGPYRLKVVLQGQPPFAVKIEQKRDNQHIGYIFKENIGSDDELELENENGGYVWNPQTINMDGMGKHEFIMISVSDSNGCILNFDSSEPVSTFFEIADQARIHTFNPSDVCIGDLLSYTLQGTPPFTIGYKWQGVPQADIIVADPMLSLWVGSSGTVEITKICNSADCCDENVSSDVSLTTRVHALPRAVVGSGDDSFDDIKEGDESSFSVDFEGTPPFSFTYARSRGSGSKSAVKEELFTVSDITEKHWSINTSQEGTFRVKSVQDRYCAYPRRLASTQGANKILT